MVLSFPLSLIHSRRGGDPNLFLSALRIKKPTYHSPMELLQRSLVFYGHTGDGVGTQLRRCGYRNRKVCSAVAVDATSSMTNTSGIRWGLSKLQGKRPEMEDDVVIRSEGFGDFTFAALFDGHAGFSSVEFLRDELYKECVAVLQGGLLLDGKNITATRNAISNAFEKVDSKLSSWLENKEMDDESGSTATVLFLRNDVLIVSHVGDSSVVVSRYGKEEVLTGPHRPYGKNSVSIGEIKRIRAAGGWISNGRICGEISVSRSFGNVRFKTKKNELLKRGVLQGRWTEKFISRVQFKGDLVVATPDINSIDLGNDVEFIILASDGLWDYIKSSDAVTFVRSELCQHGDVQMACEALAQAALGRDSEDNISVVIADLGRTDWRNLSVQGPNMYYQLSQVFATIAVVSVGIWMSSFLRV